MGDRSVMRLSRNVCCSGVIGFDKPMDAETKVKSNRKFIDSAIVVVHERPKWFQRECRFPVYCV